MPPPTTKASSPNPADGATGVSATLDRLRWTNGNGTSRRVYFGTNSASLPQLIFTVASVATLSSALAYSTTYYWRVDEINSDGTTTGDVWSFTTEAEPGPPKVTGPTPADDATGVARSVALSWGASSGATFYRLYIGTSADNLEHIDDVSGTSKTVLLSAYSTEYFWRVDPAVIRVLPTRTITTTGDVWSFTTEAAPAPDPPGTFALTSPADDATAVSRRPTLSWGASTGAITYRILMRTSGGNYSTVATVSGTSYTLTTAQTLAYGTTYEWYVIASNQGGTRSSAAWSFTTVPEAPAQASAPNPANGFTGFNIEHHLRWNAGARATSHVVYFGTSSTFGSSDRKGSQAGTSFDPGTLQYSTTYYWRIDEVNAGGTTTGATWSFTTQARPPDPPGTFALTAPTNGASGVGTLPEFSWGAASGATEYQVYLRVSGGSYSRVATVTATSYTYDRTALAYSTTYEWYVIAANQGGTRSSTASTFTTEAEPVDPPGAFTLSSPANGAVRVSRNPTLSWGASSDATTYEVWARTGSSGSFTMRAVRTTTSYEWQNLAADTTYQWYVVAKNTSGTRQSSTWSFTTAAQAAAAATGPIPGNGGAGVSRAPTLEWTAGARATSRNVYFGTDSTPDADSGSSELVYSGTATTYTPPDTLDASTEYFWRVDEINAEGVVTTGTVWSFTTGTALPPPAKPSLISPVHGATGVSRVPRLSWRAAARADSYDVYFGTAATLGDSHYQGNVPGTAFRPPDSQLTANTRYYWRVVAKNASGDTSSDTRRFNTGSTAVAVAIDQPSLYEHIKRILQEGDQVTLTPDDTDSELTIAASRPVNVTDTQVYGFLKLMLQEGSNVTLTPNDSREEIEISATPTFNIERSDVFDALKLIMLGSETVVPLHFDAAGTKDNPFDMDGADIRSSAGTIVLVATPTIDLSEATVYAYLARIMQQGAQVTLTKDATTRRITIAASAPFVLEEEATFDYLARIMLAGPNVEMFRFDDAGSFPAGATLADGTRITAIPGNRIVVTATPTRPSQDQVYGLLKLILQREGSLRLRPDDAAFTITIWQSLPRLPEVDDVQVIQPFVLPEAVGGHDTKTYQLEGLPAGWRFDPDTRQVTPP